MDPLCPYADPVKDRSQPPLAAPMPLKLAWALACNEALGADLRLDGVLGLSDFALAIDASHQAIDASGMLTHCRRCEQERGGSCCGKGLEERYDAPLLLVNLLLGVTLPSVRGDQRSCLFLGPLGCSLLAREVICVNYVCTELSAAINPLALSTLRVKEGLELEALFKLRIRLDALLHSARWC